ncbi:hypothetical protein D8N35_06010 [Enterococcus casseliflavus]|nr:hypothetical protein D8N35_06010 [Enterococcus casseliflavus]
MFHSSCRGSLLICVGSAGDRLLEIYPFKKISFGFSLILKQIGSCYNHLPQAILLFLKKRIALEGRRQDGMRSASAFILAPFSLSVIKEL